MATEMQIKANRKNALKSTGPRTEEGKDASSQNAIKHGLRAKRDVIKTENQDEFDIYRTKMLDDLLPDGAMEEMLAERIVSLSWRLKRAEHFQNAVIDALIDYGLHETVSSWHMDSAQRARKEAAETGELDIILGIVINKDFANAKTLEQILIYERRIESSLYRTIAELKKVKHTRLEQEDDVARASSQCMHGQDAHATNAGTNEPNLKDESSESHLHPEKSVQDDFDKLSRDEDGTHLEKNRIQNSENKLSLITQENKNGTNEANFCRVDR